MPATGPPRAPHERMNRPKLGVFKFASCDGCQLSILNLEDDLLAVSETLDIAYFPEASSDMREGPYDIALVEGSITTPEDLHRIVSVRERAKVLMTIGACATAGGIQALRNWSDVEAFKQAVYPSPQYIQSLSTSTPISEHVRVDFELWGCPIEKTQLMRVLIDLFAGVQPKLPTHSLCLDCKRRGMVCVLVTKGEPCMGPVTRTGCGVICPASGAIVTAASDHRRALHRVRPSLQTPARSPPSFITGCNSSRPRCCAVFAASTATSRRFERKVRRGNPGSRRPHPESLAKAMSEPQRQTRTIKIDTIARVEGEGALRVTVKNGLVDDVELRIFEPPRFFEAFLQGRHYEELPDIVARICGICPVAYQMSAVHAVESIFGVQVTGALRDLRRLLYCGEWVESHALHVYMLQAPDFLGYESGIAMAKDHAHVVTRGLRIKKAGNALMALLGGRSVHPVSVRVGGFSRARPGVN